MDQIKNLFQSKYLKMLLLLGAAFVISDFGVKNIFIANSPKINPYAGQNMIAKVNNTTSKMMAFAGGLFNFSGTKSGLIKDLPQQTLNAMNAPLKQVSQGVYAAEQNNINVYEIRTNEIDYLVYTFTIKGKEIKIKVPKDQKPPTQAEMDSLYK